MKQSIDFLKTKLKGDNMLEPLRDRIIVKPVSAETVRPSGIIIPDVAQEKSQYGEVVAVGEGERASDGILIPNVLKEGDTVLFGKYSGTEVELNGEEYLIMRESDVYAREQVKNNKG